MKYIFVGDIHGKVDQVERALAKDGKKIFVGDLMDSFNRSWVDHSKCLRLVLDAVDTGEAEVIYGNHDLQYLNPHHKCSGWCLANESTMFVNREEVEKKFKPYIFLSPEFLVTHAGLTNQLWVKKHLTFDTLEQRLIEGWPKTSSFVHQIGQFRGGFSSVGGIFWCDFNAEFEPIHGLTQVFGHTAGKGIRKLDNSFCIDCLDHEHSFLEMDL